MFTGIVRAVGRTVGCRPAGDGVRIAIATGADALAATGVGDSIAVNGCCLTVVAVEPGVLEFEASAETLACTTGFPEGGAVNLESALRLSDRLDGHLVSGHVDAAGVVAAFAPVASAGKGPGAGAPSFELAIDVPAGLARFVAPKGSITVDGVSLTTNAVTGLPDGSTRFTVNLIPHTLAVTTLGSLRTGMMVNVEVDLVARYLDRLRGDERTEHEPGG